MLKKRASNQCLKKKYIKKSPRKRNFVVANGSYKKNMGEVSFNGTTKERMVLTKDGQEPGSSWLDGYIFSLSLPFSTSLCTSLSTLGTFIYARVYTQHMYVYVYMVCTIATHIKLACTPREERCDRWIAARRSGGTREKSTFCAMGIAERCPYPRRKKKKTRSSTKRCLAPREHGGSSSVRSIRYTVYSRRVCRGRSFQTGCRPNGHATKNLGIVSASINLRANRNVGRLFRCVGARGRTRNDSCNTDMEMQFRFPDFHASVNKYSNIERL